MAPRLEKNQGGEEDNTMGSRPSKRKKVVTVSVDEYNQPRKRRNNAGKGWKSRSTSIRLQNSGTKKRGGDGREECQQEEKPASKS